VHVTEPPLVGRPAGYEVCDVGVFSMSAAVDPRTSEVGGAVAVTVTVAGIGNVPRSVRIPLKSSLEWLDPQLREAFDADRGKIHGSRTFAYVVRPKSAGDIDLGEVTLPFWNPDKRSYETARAQLGKIKVAPGAAAATGAEPRVAHDPWSAIGDVRPALGTFPRPRLQLTDRPAYWLALFAAPLAVVSGSLIGRTARIVRARLAARRTSSARSVEHALDQARAAMKRNDAGAAAAALDRAMHTAIEAATGVRSRGILIEQLPAALEAAGIAKDLATEVKEVLSAVDAARFTPDSSDPLSALVVRAEKAAAALGQTRRPGK
jgi:hypothetical protein